MADVTINDLTGQTPTSTDVFPFSTTGGTPSTYKATLTQLKTGLGLAAVAITGSYNDLLSKPTIPTSTSQLTNNSGYLTNSSAAVAKAWVRFNGPGTNVPADGANVTSLISASYNISSLFYYNRNGWRAYFTTPFANANNLCGTGSSSGNQLAHNLIGSVSFTTTYVQFYTPNGGNVNTSSTLLPTGATSFIVFSL